MEREEMMMRPRFGILERPRSINEAVEHARIAEDVGFDLLGVVDSQSIFRETYATLSIIADRTSTIQIGTAATNPATRHLAVTASAIATVDEVAGGRAFLGIATGDSAVLNLGLAPVRLAGLRTAVTGLAALLRGEHTEYNGTPIHASWVPRPVPIYVAAEGPRTLEMAGELADGVICGMGLTDDLISRSLDHISRGAERSGRQLTDLDIWAVARVNVGQHRDRLIGEIRSELASTAHHAFRATLDGKAVPSRFKDGIHAVQSGYRTTSQGELGTSENAALMKDPEFVEYMASRFAVVGPPAACVEAIQRIRAAGISNVLFTGFIKDRKELLLALGNEVLPKVS